MSEFARPRAFVLWFLTEPKEDFGAPAPWSFEGSPVTSSTLRLGVERQRHLCIFVRGTWRPPSFVEKLLSGTRGQGDCDCVHERDLVAE